MGAPLMNETQVRDLNARIRSVHGKNLKPLASPSSAEWDPHSPLLGGSGGMGNIGTLGGWERTFDGDLGAVDEWAKSITGTLPSNGQRREILAQWEKSKDPTQKALLGGEYLHRMRNWVYGNEFIGEPIRRTDAEIEQNMKGLWRELGVGEEELGGLWDTWWMVNKDKQGFDMSRGNASEASMSGIYQRYRDPEGGKVASPSGGVKRRGPGGGTKSSPSGISPGGYNATTSGLGPRRRLVSLD